MEFQNVLISPTSLHHTNALGDNYKKLSWKKVTQENTYRVVLLFLNKQNIFLYLVEVFQMSTGEVTTGINIC